MPCTASTGVMLYNFNLPQRLYSLQKYSEQFTVNTVKCTVYNLESTVYTNTQTELIIWNIQGLWNWVAKI